MQFSTAHFCVLSDKKISYADGKQALDRRLSPDDDTQLASSKK